MRENLSEERDDNFTIRLVNESGKITDFDYTPTSIEEIWENAERYLSYCERERPELKVSIKIAFEYTNTPHWVFLDNRTSELIQLYFAMKQNPMFLFGTIENTPAIWIEAVAIQNQLWQQ